MTEWMKMLLILPLVVGGCWDNNVPDERPDILSTLPDAPYDEEPPIAWDEPPEEDEAPEEEPPAEEDEDCGDRHRRQHRHRRGKGHHKDD